MPPTRCIRLVTVRSVSLLARISIGRPFQAVSGDSRIKHLYALGHLAGSDHRGRKMMCRLIQLGGRVSYVPLSDFFKDKFVAPEISSFTAAVIPDMSAVSKEQRYWLLNFVLNSGLRVTMDDALRRTLYNFLRRTEAAFREYEAARKMTTAYLANANPDAVSEYIVAIGHWEVFLSQAYQAKCLLASGEKILFRPGDGSIMQRLNLLYNRAKHAEKAITSQQLPPDGTLPVWMKNDGLHCVESSLTFDEIAEILQDLARWADIVQDPLILREKLEAERDAGQIILPAERHFSDDS